MAPPQGLVDVLPLAPLQRGLLFHALYNDRDLDVYTVQHVFEFTRPVDATALRASAAEMLRRHPNLRAGFAHEGMDEPVQFIPAEAPVDWREIDLRGFDEEERERRLLRLRREERERRFDLTRPPLIRNVLVRCSAERTVLVETHHHIIMDGWSGTLYIFELLELYRHGADPAALAPARPYRDYLQWLAQRGATNDGAGNPSIAAWREELADLSGPTLVAPPDVGRAPVMPRSHEAQVPDATVAALTALARQRGVTPNAVLSTAWALALRAHTGRDDIVFGNTVSGRPPEIPDVDSIIGLFFNTIPVRVTVRPDETVADLFTRVHRRQGELLPHHHTDLAEIQRQAGVGALFDTLYVLRNTPKDDQHARELQQAVGLERVSAADATHYPLTFVAQPGETLTISLAYRPDLFDDATARTLFDRVLTAVERIVAEPDLPVAQLDLLTEDERRAVLTTFNDTAADIPERTIPELFEEAVRQWPDRTALVCHDTQLTFAELNACANRMARLLVGYGAGPERLVALGLPRSEQAVVALFAVLKAGAGYVPLDLEHPPARLAETLTDAGPAVTLVTRASQDRVPEVAGSRRLVIDDDAIAAELAACHDHDLTDADRDAPLHLDALAYTIYTSGSTGRPKGVAVGHRGLTNMLYNHRHHIFDPVVRRAGNRVLRVAHTVSFSFDMSWEELLWLVQGHEVHLLDEEMRRDSHTLTTYCARHHIDVINVTPSYCGQLIEDGLLDSVHRPPLVLLGGEAVSEAVWERLAATPDVLGYNLYGPTEYTINTLGGGTEDSATPTVGRPIFNTCAYVLDSGLAPVAPGVAGELYIAGVGMARGYVGRPDLTAERFVANPFGPPGSRLYRTGDLVRWCDDGTIDFLGRADDQIKIRGYRVEPGEIATVLEAHPDVAQAAVVVRTDAPGVQRLVGYVVPTATAEGTDAEPIDTATVRAVAAARLPEYMVPAIVMAIDELPLTTNGKLDRDALPRPDTGDAGGREPRDEQEELLCRLFAETLGLSQVSIDDDFFALGGHSLLAMRLVGRLRKETGTRLTAGSLATAPTVARLAELLSEGGGPNDPLAPLLPLRTAGRAAPLFCVHPAAGFGWSFAGLAPYIADRPIYALQSPGLRGETIAADIDTLVDDYLGHIRTVQPEGPYHLLGWSFGGQVVHRLATRLRAQGERVGLLAILDTYPVDEARKAARAEPVPSGPQLEQEALDFLLRGSMRELPQWLHPPYSRSDVTELIRENGGVWGDFDERTLSAVVDTYRANAELMTRMSYAEFDGDLLFFAAAENPAGEAQAWHPYVAGDVDAHVVNAGHETLTGPAALSHIGPVVAKALQRSAG
ncbi:non-ribosomal peptide synthetase [Salinactinospora qingdaonensis]|uniref:Carrier domain-containing protein n=1 Tax=Salinactinospora qingdaonensis TaxID=702744 RepID=A0ABP7F062_9ACTN